MKESFMRAKKEPESLKVFKMATIWLTKGSLLEYNSFIELIIHKGVREYEQN